MNPLSCGSLDLAPRPALVPASSTPPMAPRRIQRYCGPAKLLSKTGQELGAVTVALDKHSWRGRAVWDGLIETADKSPIERLLRRRFKCTVVLPGGGAGTVWIRRLTAGSPIAALTGAGQPPF